MRTATATLVMCAAVLVTRAHLALACAPCPDATSVTISTPANGSKATFSQASPGQKAVGCNATPDPDCNTCSWTCEDVLGTQEIWLPDPPEGDNSVTLILKYLPSNNSQFGNTWVKATADGKSDTNTFKLFFPKTATNNPGGSAPNWYYYWKQTSATSGTHQYWQYYSETTWEGGAWVSHIGPESCGSSTPPEGKNSGQQLDGIDLFAYTCRHEAKHQADNSAWFPNGYNPDIDFDEQRGDLLPDSLEASLGGTQENPLNGGPFSPDDTDTDNDQRIDSDDYVMNTQATWAVGSADGSDWANPGHQY